MFAFSSWSVTTAIKEGETCVHIHIVESLDITNLELLILDEDRKPIVRMKVMDREIYFCMMIGNPMFAQLGDCIRYVDGSGSEFYK